MSQFRVSDTLKEHTVLLNSINEDIELIKKNALAHKRLLKEFPSVLDDNYLKKTVNAVKELKVAEMITDYQLSSLHDAANAHGDEIHRQFEDSMRNQPRCNSRTNFEEVRFVEEMLAVNRPKSVQKTARSSRRQTDDVEVLETDNTAHIDPLTRARIKTPVQNKRCGHIYCYESISAHIQRSSYPPCPYVGCSLPHIREDDLVFVQLD